MAFHDMNVRKDDRILVDKVLEQGQKLRNAMVESILKNDPLYTEIFYNTHFNTPNPSSLELSKENKEENFTSNKQRLEAFIRGDCMTPEDEKLALESLKSLSAPDLCNTTERSLKYSALGSCKCYTCEMYNSNYYKWNVEPKCKPSCEDAHKNHNEVTDSIRNKYKSELIGVLKFVDSLKVSVNCLILNDTGQQKLLSSIPDRSNFNNFIQNFFLEYTIPDILMKQKSKINSSLDKSYVRLFSRKTNDVINFKQVTLHDIERMKDIDLNCCNMQFKVSFRNFRQKSIMLLGYANFNFGEFLSTKNATCTRGLVVNLNDSPISVGTLKVSLQLGCGRLYFGQEFIEAIKTSNEESVVLDSDDSTNQLVGEQQEKQIQNQRDIVKSCQKSTAVTQKSLGKAQPPVTSFKKSQANVKCHEGDKINQNLCKHSHDVQTDSSLAVRKNNVSSYFEKQLEKSNPDATSRILPVQIEETEKQVLFGFFYVAEAQYLSRPINSYLTCRPFAQNETSVSQLIASSQNPVFNYQQIIPLVFEDDLLTQLRENYMVIEFWQREDTTNTVIGLTKIPLHQFYLAYRNPVILKYLMKNRLPIVGTDWWEPVYSVNNEDILGQVQVLTALGTQDQINNLKIDRGFAGSFVKAQFSNPLSNRNHTAKLIANKVTDIRGNTAIPNKKVVFKKVHDSKLDKLNFEKGTSTATIPVLKFDAATQSETNMENKAEKQENNNAATNMLESFLHQLMAKKTVNLHVENSTNTEPAPQTDDSNSNLEHAQNKTNVELRKTSDLLDSLQKALSCDNSQFPSSSRADSTFRAMVAINSANHLPSRKKCKSRKSRSRPIKSEESVLPSCYVSFEASCEGDLKVTPIVPKSTNPMWNYKCKVNLPLDLLQNGQKRLIFKVWRKSINTVNFPNMQTDIVLGFAAVDLTVLLVGFPNVQGWFNILDFSGKCNGQINIHVTPLDDLTKYQAPKDDRGCNAKPAPEIEVATSNEASENLSRALKRKFTELDEITQRLRLRLSKVTNESDSSSDGFADEFEKDISCSGVDENVDDFTKEVRKMDAERVPENIGGGTKDVDSILQSEKAASSSNVESEPELSSGMIEHESFMGDAGE